MSDSSNKTNNQQAELPKWIEPKLFEGVLTETEANFKEIYNFNVDHALAPGENFLTIMLKVEIVMKLKDDSLKPITFMLKVGHDNDVSRDLMKKHDIFDVESGMYRDIVPEFEQMYADVGVKVKFGAKSYQLPTDHPYILLENLKVQGFKNVNRIEGFDMEHTKSVLKKIAQWHAASAVRVASKGMYPQEYSTAFFKPESYELMKSIFDSNTQTILDCFKDYDNAEDYYDKVARLQPRMTDEIFKILPVDPNEFNVLNHGDCWSNNIMFKYDDNGKLEETYLVDFQLPRYTTPAQDLLYFIISSTKLDIKLKEFDYFIKYYHENLTESLELLKYGKSIPSLKEIHTILFKYGIFAYMTSTNIMAAALCDPNDNASLDNFTNDSEEGMQFKKLLYSNARYRKHMEAILPWFLYRGILDC